MFSLYILTALLAGSLSVGGEPPSEQTIVSDAKKPIAQLKEVEFKPKQPVQETGVSSSEPVTGDAGVWDKLAACESGGQWDYNGSSGFDGGLQFLPSTWSSLGTGYAYAWQAPREVQIEAGKKLQASYGWSQWPSCSSQLGLL